MESVISSGDTLCDVVKAGCLKKVRTNKKKFFVLRRGSALGPARLEYYDSEKRFSKPGAVPKRIVKIRDCWNISGKKDPKQKNTIVIFTREDSLALVADENEHESWLNELKDLHEAEFSKAPNTTPKYDHMWNVQVKPTSLGAHRSYMGKYRLCLGPTSVSLIRLDTDTADLEIPLNTIRRCGHNESHFVMGVGRSAPTGEGDLALQVDDAATSQNMHEVILGAMKSNKSSDSSSTRTRTRSCQSRKSASAYRATLPSIDLTPMTRPRTLSESTKTSSYSSPHRHSPKAPERRAMSMAGRGSIMASSTASSPFSSCSSIDHGFRIRSDSSGSRATTTSEEDSLSRHSAEHGADGDDYLDMTCGGNRDLGQTLGSEEESCLAAETSSKHSSQSLEVVNEDSGYMEMASGGSASSSRQDGAGSRRPSLISNPHDDYCLHSSLDADYLLHAASESPDHATPVADSSDSERPDSMTGRPELRSEGVRIPVPAVRDSSHGDYMPMGPCHSLPTVQERSGETRVFPDPHLMDRGFGIIFPSNDLVPSYLNDQCDFPKRAYSVGSRPEIKPKKAKLEQEKNSDSKSSSAPHLLVEQKRLQSPASSRSNVNSPCHSRRGSRDDPDLFMEVSFDRRSDSLRPRTSSWGQAIRPRTQSHASKLKRDKSFQQPRVIVKGPGSSESLTKIHYVSPANHDYSEISPLATESGAKQIQQLANRVHEMTLQYNSETPGQVGIVTRNSRPPRMRTSHIVRRMKPEDTDTYVLGEPLSIKNNDGIPRMVDVWTPHIKPGDEDEDEYMCLNPGH